MRSHSIEYDKVTFELFRNSNQLIIKGEITNGSGISYSVVAVRVIIFIKNAIVVNEVFLVNALDNGATKTFERHIYDLKPQETIEDITRFELFTESCLKT